MMEHDIAWWFLILFQIFFIVYILYALFNKKSVLTSKWSKRWNQIGLFGFALMAVGSLCMEYYLNINNTLGLILLGIGFAFLIISGISDYVITKKVPSGTDTFIGKVIIWGIILILVYVFL